VASTTDAPADSPPPSGEQERSDHDGHDRVMQMIFVMPGCGASL
jgi:hypothetical protein